MTFDTEAEARMWATMLDKSRSDVIEAECRWSSAQSQQETVEDLVTEYIEFRPRGDSRTLKDYLALQRDHITTGIEWKSAVTVEAKDPGSM